MLSKIFTALREKFGDEVAFVGPRRMNDNTKPPFIRWNPISAQILTPTRAGGGPRDDGDVARRHWSVEVEVWGDGLDATEALVDKLRASVHDLGTHFSFPPEGDETWDTGGQTSKGVVCVLRLIVMAPVLRTVKPVVRPIIVPVLKLNDTPV